MQRKPLGRGLAALIPDILEAEIVEAGQTSGAPVELPIHQIKSNRHQPRTRFTNKAMEELEASIRIHGVVQPIVVRPMEEGTYEIVAGERRLRAALQAGLSLIPAVVRDADDGEALEIALVENILREDLSPIEEARAFITLIENYGLSQEEVGKRVGRDRSTVSNTLRLLTLPDELQEEIGIGGISAGHARAILMLERSDDQKALGRAIQREGLSVRATEVRARRMSGFKKGRQNRQHDVFIQSIAEEFTRNLGTRVVIRPRRKGGVVEIHYFSDEELEGLRAKIRG